METTADATCVVGRMPAINKIGIGVGNRTEASTKAAARVIKSTLGRYAAEHNIDVSVVVVDADEFKANTTRRRDVCIMMPDSRPTHGVTGMELDINMEPVKRYAPGCPSADADGYIGIPAYVRRYYLNRSMFDFPLGEIDHVAFLPDTDEPIAHIDKGTIKIYLNLMDLEAPVAEYILTVILDRLFQSTAEGIINYDFAEEKAVFRDKVLSRYKQRASTLEDRISSNTASIADTYRHALELHNKVKDDIMAKEVLDLALSGEHAALDDEFMLMMNLSPGVFDSVDIVGNNLIAVTKKLSAFDDRTETLFFVGQYEIRVDLGRSESSIPICIKNRMMNRNWRHHHPHVNDSGSPCWGSIGEAVTKLLAEGKFANLLGVINHFLQSYNEGDAYVKRRDWIKGIPPEYVAPEATPASEAPVIPAASTAAAVVSVDYESCAMNESTTTERCNYCTYRDGCTSQSYVIGRCDSECDGCSYTWCEENPGY